jgi:hypothetical protein
VTFYQDMGLTLRTVDELAEIHVRIDQDITDVDRMWGLFVEAVETARSLPGIPRLSGPVKSAMPEAPDEVTYWDVVAAYIRGDTEEMPEVETRSAATRAQMTRHDLVMAYWHSAALRGKGDWRRLRRALWDYARGEKRGRVLRNHGVTSMGLTRLKKQAMADMIKESKKSGYKTGKSVYQVDMLTQSVC